VYIAQPPLYKVKMGKREEYIETEEEMDNLILDLGCEGLKLTRIKGGMKFADSKFREILGLLVELENLGSIINKKGVDFRKYLSFREAKTKKLPIYRVKVEGITQFVYSETALAKATKKAGEAVEYLELFEAGDIEKIIARLEKLGIDMETYFPPAADAQFKKKKEKLRPIYKITNTKETHYFFSLWEVLKFVKSQAKKGMIIQRYKGLGEMNPQQLWETTMDPQRRTILQVTLEDAVEADKTFTILMGDQVQPRREFIETYAHTVRNLDI
jgi:DNA gyrase subunit B